MPRKKPVYTREFKMAILAQINNGIPVPQVARENGLHPSLIFRQRQLYLDDPGNAFAGPGNPYESTNGGTVHSHFYRANLASVGLV